MIALFPVRYGHQSPRGEGHLGRHECAVLDRLQDRRTRGAHAAAAARRARLRHREEGVRARRPGVRTGTRAGRNVSIGAGGGDERAVGVGVSVGGYCESFELAASSLTSSAVGSEVASGSILSVDRIREVNPCGEWFLSKSSWLLCRIHGVS